MPIASVQQSGEGLVSQVSDSGEGKILAAGDEVGNPQRILDEIAKSKAAIANVKPHDPERGY